MSSVLFLSSINVPPSALYAETQGNADTSYIDGDTVSGEALEVMGADAETGTTDVADSETEEPSISVTEESKLSFDKSTGTITGCDKTLTELVIPETIDGVDVYAIADSAFSGNSALTSVIIPDCVTTIGKKAFYKCTALKSVDIGNGVKAIPINAFYGCTALNNVNIGSGIEVIDDYAFYGCSNLLEVTGMASVKEVGLRAFFGCNELSSVPVGDSLEVVEDYAFPSSVEFGELPKNIKRIGINGFYVDSQLVKIPAGVEYMNNNAVYGKAVVYVFEGDDVRFETNTPVYIDHAYDSIVANAKILEKLKSNYNFRYDIDNITVVEDEGCTYFMDKDGEMLYIAAVNSDKIRIPEGVKEIRAYAFNDLSGIKEIILPEGIEKINDWSFFGKDQNISVYVELPKSLKNISVYSFYKLNPDFVCVRGSYAESFLNKNNMKYHYKDNIVTYDCGEYSFQFETEFGKIMSYEGKLPEELVIPEEINGVKVRALADNVFQTTDVTSVTLPETIAVIPKYAFDGSKKLKSITAPGVVQINENAFYNCSALENVTFSPELQVIGSYAFGNCNALKTFSAENVTSLDSQAFYQCTALESVSLPSVVVVPQSCFAGCQKLTKVDMPAMTIVSGYAFYDTGDLRFSDTKELKQVMTYAFANSKMATFGASELLTAIESNSFAKSVILYGYENSYIINFAKQNGYNYEIIDKDTEINNAVNLAYEVEGGNIYFNTLTGKITGCDKTVTKAVIPESINGTAVKEIEKEAFANLPELKEVVIPESVTSIGANAFEGCNALETINIPASVTTVGETIIKNCGALKYVEISADIMASDNAVIYNCYTLEEIKLNEGVTKLSGKAFQNVSNLKKITLPKSLESYSVIESNYRVLVLYYSDTTLNAQTFPRYCVDNSEVIEFDNGKIYVDKTTGTVTGAEGTFTEAVIPAEINGTEIKAIDNYAFNAVSTLRKLTIEGETTTITSSFASNGINLYCKHNSAVEKVCKQNNKLFSYSDYVDGEIFEINGIKLIFDKETQTVTRVMNAPETVEFPAEIDGVKVKRIGSDVLYPDGKASVKNVKIADTIEEICQSAFVNCSGIESIEIGNGVVTIGNTAFAGCTGLTDVSFGDSVVSLGNNVFSGCYVLKNVNFGKGISKIGDSAFYNCGLEELVIDCDVEEIGRGIISNSAVKRLEISGNIGKISEYAFSNSNLISVDITGNVNEISNYAFNYCIGLESVNLGDSIQTIGSYAFSSCSKLAEVNLGDGVQTIGDHAFYCCRELENITFGKNLQSIGDWAFYDCTKLKKVDIVGDNLDIGGYAFYYCSSLEEVNLGEGVVTVGENAFSGCYSLKKINIGNDVKEIGNYAFSSTSGDSLCELTFGNSVESIGNSAFSGKKFDSIVLPESLKNIGNSAFNCSFNKITVGSSVETVGSYAFTDYRNSGIVVYNAMGGTFGSNAINPGTTLYCYKDSAVQARAEADHMKYYLIDDFADINDLFGKIETSQGNIYYEKATGEITGADDSVKNLIIPEEADGGVKIVGIKQGAFSNNSSIESVVIPDTITRINYGTFRDCSALESVEMGNGVQDIQSYAFYNCRKLSNVKLSDSLRTIGEDAFAYADLRGIVLEENVENVDKFAFYGTNLNYAIIKNDNITLDENCFAQYYSDNRYYHTGVRLVANSSSKAKEYYTANQTEFQPLENLVSYQVEGGNIYIDKTNSTVVICEDNVTEADIPSTIDGITVKSISNLTFKNHKNIKKIAVPETVSLLSELANTSSVETIRIYNNNAYLSNTTFNIANRVVLEVAKNSKGHKYAVSNGIAYQLFNEVNVSTSTGGTASVSGKKWIADGGNFVVEATADEGYKLASAVITSESGTKIYKDADAKKIVLNNLTESKNIKFNFVVDDAVSSDLIVEQTSLLLEPNKNTQLVYKIDPSTTEDMGIVFVSENPEIAVVDADDGTVYAKEVGETTISVYSSVLNKTQTVNVKVYDDEVPAFTTAPQLEFVSSNKVKFNWAEANDNYAVKEYEISRNGKVIATTTEQSLLDTDLEDNTAYKYEIVAIDKAGNRSAAVALSVVTRGIDVTEIGAYPASGTAFGNVATETIGAIVDDAYIKGSKLNVFISDDNGETYTQLEAKYIKGIKEVYEKKILAAYLPVGKLATGDYVVKFVVTDASGEEITTTASYKIDNSAPNAPTGFIAVEGAAVDVMWDKAEDEDVAGYKVYRMTNNASGYKCIYNTESKNIVSYTDATVTTGVYYKYAVAAYDAFGNESELSDSVYTALRTDSVAPKILGININNDPNITQGAILGGNAQTVYVKAYDNTKVADITLYYSLDGENWSAFGAEINRVKEPTVCFTVDVASYKSDKIYFKAECMDIYGNKSEMSEIYMYNVDYTAPEKVTGLKAEADATSILLNWNDITADDFSYFAVEENVDGSYKKIASVKDKRGYQVNGLKPESTHTYRVYAVDIYGNVGEASDEVTATTVADTTAPAVTAINPYTTAPNQYVNFTVYAKDDYTIETIELQYSYDGESWETLATVNASNTKNSTYWIGSATYRLDVRNYPEGIIQIRAIPTDSYGNRGSEKTTIVKYNIDYTAPNKLDSLSVTGDSNAIILSWDASDDAGAKAYKIYSKCDDSSSFNLVSQISSNNKTYTIKNPLAEREHFYYVTVVDSSGNESEPSNIESIYISADEEKPEIQLVSPEDGSAVVCNTQVNLSATDDFNVARICLEYKAENGVWKTLVNSDYSHDNANTQRSLSYKLTNDLDVELLEMRAYAYDRAGNKSDEIYFSYNYNVDEPKVKEFLVTPDIESVHIYADISEETRQSSAVLYKAYSGENFIRIATVEIKDGMIDYTDTNVSHDNIYDYKLQITSVDDNNNSYFKNLYSRNVNPLAETAENDKVPPVAKINCDKNIMKSVLTTFSAVESTDNFGIKSYRWIIDDTVELNGVTAQHIFTTDGEHTVKLIVTDIAGNTDETTETFNVFDKVAMGSVKLRLNDNYGMVVPNVGIYINYGSDDQYRVETDNNGECTLNLPAGDYLIGIYGEGYLPCKKTITVKNGVYDAVEMISVTKKNIVTGSLTHKKLSLEEAEKIGIDITSAENTYVYEYTIKIEGEKYVSYVKNGEVVIGKNFRTNSGGVGTVVTYGGQDKTSSPKVMVFIMELPGTVTWTKDFFEVNLTVINEAKDAEFVIDNSMVKLNVPSGLSLMDVAGYQNTDSKEIGEFAGGETNTTSWILRGDKQGKYDLTADFTGFLRGFNEDLHFVFKSDEPLEVSQGKNLAMELKFERIATGNFSYALRVGVKNKSNESMSAPNINLGYAERFQQFKQTASGKFVAVNGQTILPGETVWADFVVPKEKYPEVYKCITTYLDTNKVVTTNKMGTAIFQKGSILSGNDDMTMESSASAINRFEICADEFSFYNLIGGSAGGGEIDQLPNVYDDRINGGHSAVIPGFAVKVTRTKFDGTKVALANKEVQIFEPGEAVPIIKKTDKNGFVYLDSFTYSKLSDSYDTNGRLMAIRVRTDRGEQVLGAPIRDSRIGQANVNGKLYFKKEGKTVVASNVKVTIDDVTATTNSNGEFSLTTKSLKGRLTVKVEGDAFGKHVVKNFDYNFSDETELRKVILLNADSDIPYISNHKITVQLVGGSFGVYDRVVLLDGMFDGKVMVEAGIATGERDNNFVYVEDSAKIRLVSPEGEIEKKALFRGDKDLRFTADNTIAVAFDISDVKVNNKAYLEMQMKNKNNNDIETVVYEVPLTNVTKPDFLHKTKFNFPEIKTKFVTGSISNFEWDCSDLWKKIKPVKLSDGKDTSPKDDDLKNTSNDTLKKTGFSFGFDGLCLGGSANYDMQGKFDFAANAGAAAAKNVANLNLKLPDEMSKFGVDGSVLYGLSASYNFEEEAWEIVHNVGIKGNTEISDIPIYKVGVPLAGDAYVKLSAGLGFVSKWAIMDKLAAESNQKTRSAAIPNEFEFKAKLGGSVGVELGCIEGIVTLLDLGAYLDIGSTYGVYDSITKNPYLNCKGDLEAGFYGGILWFKTKEGFIKEKWTIYDSRDAVEAMSFDNGIALDDKIFVLATADAQKQWLGGSLEKTDNTIESGAYESNGITIVKLPDGRRLAVFADYANSGTDVNSIRNMYSVYANGQWSEPKVIFEDGTPDIQPTLVKTDKGAHLIWINANDKLASDKMESIESLQTDYADMTDLWEVDFDADSNTWSTPACVTSESTGFKYGAKYANNGTSSMTAYLASNSLSYNENDPVRIEFVYKNANDEVVSSGAINIPASNVMDIELGYDAKGYKIAYTDGASGKINLTSFNGTNWSYPNALNTNSTSQTSPVFINSDNGELLLYYVNGNAIYAKDITENSKEVIMIQNKYTENAIKYDIFVEDSRNAMVWQNSGKQLLLSYYDSINKCYGNGIEVTEIASNEFISDVNVTFTDKGATVVYTRKTIGAEGKLSANIESVFLPYGVDLTVGNVKYLTSSAPLQETSISFDVSNVGIGTNTGFKAYVSTNKDGSNPIGQCDSTDKLVSGDTAYAEITFTMPENQTPLYLVVESVNDDTDSTNDSIELDGLYNTKLKVVRANVLDGMDSSLMVQVENRSAWNSGDFVVKVYEVNSKTVLAQRTVTGLEAFRDAEFALDLADLADEYYDEDGKALVYVAAESTDSENPVEYSNYLMILHKPTSKVTVVSELAIETYNLIESIGEVTLEDKETIEKAEENLKKLTTQADIDYVSNVDKLIEARKQLDELLKGSEVSELAIETYNLIESIGEVTLEDKETIEKAEENLKKLTTQADIDYVSNKDKLIEARKLLNEILKDKVPFVYGDVNYDGKVTAADSGLTLQYSLNSSSVGFIDDTKVRADVSGDGAIGAYDSAMIMQKALLNTYKFPVEEDDKK